MLKIIEEDADSFAQRAEMYYKKRPELITMVEEFYRSHRSLAERYDQVKSDSGSRLLTTWASPLSFTKYRADKLMIMSFTERSYDSYSETYEPEESGESEVDDPEQEEESKFNEVVEEEEEVSSEVDNYQVMKLKEELDKLKEENKLQQEQLMQKDEEKKEAIRQLSFAVDMLKEDNVKLRKMVAAKGTLPKKQSPLEFNKLKEVFWGKLFNRSPKPQTSAACSLELIASK